MLNIEYSVITSDVIKSFDCITKGLMNGLAVRANPLAVLSLPMILGNLCNVPRSAATPMSVS